jgi:C-terminal processing protease CtpA/Prc
VKLRKKIVKKIIFITILLAAVNVYSNILYQPDNLNFEQGRPGFVPDGWVFPSKLATAGYIAFIEHKNVYEGRFSVAIDNPHYNADTAIVEGSPNMSTLYQSVDAFPFRNKTVRFSAWVKCDIGEPDAKGELWIVVRNEKKESIVAEYGEDDLIKDNVWHKKEITAFIPYDADELRFGFLLNGKARLWADAASIDIINPDGAVDLPPQKLSDKVIPTLVTFAKLYGYMHHFYPSHNFRSIDQERLLLYSISRILDKPDNFISDMRALLKDIAPEANILKKNEQMNYSYRKPASLQERIAYVAEIAGGPVVKNSPAFYSMLRNVYSTTRSREGSVFQNIDMIKYDNRKVIVTAMVKVDGTSPGSNAQIWCKTDIINSQDYTFATNSENPAFENEWKKYSVEINMPENVYNLRLALVFLGEGTAYFDDVKVQVYDGEKLEKEFIVPNGDFEQSGLGNTLNSWEIEPAVLSAGYSAGRDPNIKYGGAFSLSIASDPETMIKFPDMGEVARFPINGQYDIAFPLVIPIQKELIADNFAEKLEIPGKPFGYNPTINDKTTRLAAVIQLWNIIKHFSLKTIAEAELENLLIQSLISVSTVNSYEEFTIVMNNMVQILTDPRVTVWNQFYDLKYGLPLVFQKFEQDVIVTYVIDESLDINAGDVITHVDGVKINDLIKDYESKHYAVNQRFAILRALTNIRVGERDSKSTLTLKYNKGETRNVSVTRNVLLYDIYEPRPEPVVELDSLVYYVDMTQVSDKTFKRITDQIPHAKAFVFDMRGHMSMSEHVLSLFSDNDLTGVRWEIPIYTKPEKQLQSKTIYSGGIIGRKKYTDTKLIFLIDESTIGYTEAVAHIIKESQIGILLGAPTAGLIGETFSTRLIGGTSVSMTGMKAYNSTYNLLNGKSVEPDVLSLRNNNKFLNYTELLLEKALELLKN